MAVVTQQQLAEKLVGACVHLHGTADARDVARYVTSLVSQLVPASDGVWVNARSGNQLLTLGVYGFPHFGSTLIFPARCWRPLAVLVGRDDVVHKVDALANV